MHWIDWLAVLLWFGSAGIMTAFFFFFVDWRVKRTLGKRLLEAQKYLSNAEMDKLAQEVKQPRMYPGMLTNETERPLPKWLKRMDSPGDEMKQLLADPEKEK